MPSPLPLRCSFCGFGNAAGAKYCNDCGSPLHLQPCNHCGAVHERKATHCHQCGEAFGAVATPADSDVESKASVMTAGLDSKTLASTPAPAFPSVAMPNALPGSRSSRTDTIGSVKESTRAPLVELAAPGLDAFFQGLWSSTDKAAKPGARLRQAMGDAPEQTAAGTQEPALEAREPTGEVLPPQPASVALQGEIEKINEGPFAEDPARSVELARVEQTNALSSNAEPESSASHASESTLVGASPVAEALPVTEDAASATPVATPAAARRRSWALGGLIALGVAAFGVYFLTSSPRLADPQSASTRGAITSGTPSSPTALPPPSTVSTESAPASIETTPVSKAPTAAAVSTGKVPATANDSIPLAQSAPVTAKDATATAPEAAMHSAPPAQGSAGASRNVARGDSARGWPAPNAPKSEAGTNATSVRALSATETKPRPPAPVSGECTDAVASLGLCSPTEK